MTAAVAGQEGAAESYAEHIEGCADAAELLVSVTNDLFMLTDPESQMATEKEEVARLLVLQTHLDENLSLLADDFGVDTYPELVGWCRNGPR